MPSSTQAVILGTGADNPGIHRSGSAMALARTAWTKYTLSGQEAGNFLRSELSPDSDSVPLTGDPHILPGRNISIAYSNCTWCYKSICLQ